MYGTIRRSWAKTPSGLLVPDRSLLWAAPFREGAGATSDLLYNRPTDTTAPTWNTYRMGSAGANFQWANATSAPSAGNVSPYHLTVAAWIRVTANGGSIIAGRYNYVSEANNQGWVLYLTTGNKFTILAYNNSATSRGAGSAQSSVANTDYFVVGTLQGSSGNNQRIYVNGILDGSNTNGTDIGTAATAGLFNVTNGGGLSQVYSFGVWARAWSADEVFHKYKDGPGGLFNQASPKRYWIINPTHAAALDAAAAMGVTFVEDIQETAMDATAAMAVTHGVTADVTLAAEAAHASAHGVSLSTATMAAAAAAVMTPAPTLINLSSVPASGGIGSIDLGGGEQLLQIFVGNYDRTRWHHRGFLTLRQQTLGRWSGTIQFQNISNGDLSALGTDEEWTPQRGQTILIKEFDEVLFRGCIREITAARPLGSNYVEYDCILADKASICDHRLVREGYPAVQDGGVQWDIADAIRDVVTKYLNGEGISLAADFPASLGDLTTATSPFIFVTQFMDEMARVTGLEWYLDEAQKLHFVDSTVGTAAPISLTETSANFRNLRSKITDVDFRTHQYVVSNRKARDTAGTIGTTETFTLTRWGDRPGAAGSPSIWDDDGGYHTSAFYNGFPPYALFTQFGIQSVISATLNGSPIEVRIGDEMTPEEYTRWVSGTEQFFFIESTGLAVVYTTAYTGPYNPLHEVGDVIVINYVPVGPVATVEEGALLVVEESDNPGEGELFGTCGSGRYDAVEQVNDIDTREGLDAIATMLRDRLGEIPKSVTFETDYPGLRVGQLLSVDLPRNLLAAIDLFITDVSWQEETSGTNLGLGSCGRWTVEATNRPGFGNWIKQWERLWRRTQHPQPLKRIQPTTIILAGGGPITDNMEISPGKINEDGYLQDVVVRLGQAPADQDLVIDVLIDGVSILPPTKLRVNDGEGEAADVILTTFARASIFATKGQTVTCTVTYENIGGSAVDARSGVCVLGWAI